jgi:hypothetical protein
MNVALVAAGRTTIKKTKKTQNKQKSRAKARDF